MTNAQTTRGSQAEAREEARRILRRNLSVYVVYACVCAAALAAAFLVPTDRTGGDDKTRRFIEVLLVISFFAATIMNLGLQWAAKILSARVYKREAPQKSAFLIAAFQWVEFGVYGGVVVMVLYYRIAAGGTPRAALPAVASVAAALYFLRIPRFLHTGLYSAKATAPVEED